MDHVESHFFLFHPSEKLVLVSGGLAWVLLTSSKDWRDKHKSDLRIGTYKAQEACNRLNLRPLGSDCGLSRCGEPHEVLAISKDLLSWQREGLPVPSVGMGYREVPYQCHSFGGGDPGFDD